ncbi:Serine/threonine-protein phosphatase 6 like protein [Argiope bruennichi]|uniref:Serine/threonine-protein phosphatase 6 like protein n=1 Tax=Argiope bruennichi TaxID=94029 RepID=A0A8T0EB30_ARGBR|nr:Serine/threonine-protein phosphatase 6 like protein [Argiope bruennichi]
MEINPSRANILTKHFVSYLHNKDCNINIVKQIILLGADVNYRDSSLNTLLHIVLQHCNDKFNLVHELLVAGTHANACNNHERTALHYAVIYSDDVEVLRELITHGAVVNLRDSDNNSALHLAVQHNKRFFTEVLIHFDADVNLRNSVGETPLIIAVKNGNLELVKVLLSSGASVSLADRNKSSPLHVAVKTPVPNQSILIELMKYGANMYYMDSHMHFPLEYAVQKYCADSSESLLTAKTLLKCGVLQYSPGMEMWSLFVYLKKYGIYPQLNTFNEECMLEMKRMKSEFIHKNFCLFDFVQEGFECKPMFQKKTSYRELIFNQILHVSRNYPIYADIIAYRLGKLDLCIKSMELCVFTQKECHEGKQQIFLTSDCVFLIAEFLSNEDVLNLITAFSDSQYFATHDFGFQNLALGKSTKRKLNQNC